MNNDDQSNHTVSDITRALRVTPILPGENEELYKKGLKALISELEAKTVLQVYLAEKIFDCLWWIRRYEEQKRATIIVEMGVRTSGGKSWEVTKQQILVREMLLKNELDNRLLKIIESCGYSLPSLQQQAMVSKHKELLELDQQISLQARILAGFQASFEVAFNRKFNIERLKLQNDLLRKDLAALEVGKNVSEDNKS